MIELSEISYAYGEIQALAHINLTIGRGEAVALLGASGSGKSTLLKVLNGIILPERGVYRFDGEVISAKKLKDNRFAKGFHQKIGFVFQNADAQLFCADVHDEVAFGPRQMGMEEEAVARRVHDCLDLLGLLGLQDRPPYHLSGGEKRKVAIAAVLALNPEVLVLDEPLNGLDPRTQRWLVAFLIQLNQTGKTLITATHNLDLVQEISRRAVLFNEQHEIAADMPTMELLQETERLKRVNFVL